MMTIKHYFVIDWDRTCEWHHEHEWCKTCGILDKPDDPQEVFHMKHLGSCRAPFAIDEFTLAVRPENSLL